MNTNTESKIQNETFTTTKYSTVDAVDWETWQATCSNIRTSTSIITYDAVAEFLEEL